MLVKGTLDVYWGLLHWQSMMTSSNGNIFHVTDHLCGEFTGDRWIPRTKASDVELWCFFDLCLNKRLSKQWWGWWFETLLRPLWRHCNGLQLVLRKAVCARQVSLKDIDKWFTWKSNRTSPQQNKVQPNHVAALSIQRCLASVRIPIIKIRLSHDSFIFNGDPCTWKDCLYIEMRQYIFHVIYFTYPKTTKALHNQLLQSWPGPHLNIKTAFPGIGFPII